MRIHVNDSAVSLGKAAGMQAAKLIKEAIAANGEANIILATGSSQFETLNTMVADKEIDWSKVIMFHLDEYIGIDDTHNASFRKYLKERFLQRVSPLKEFHLINAETDAQQEAIRLSNLISSIAIDVALVGIGENGHLAFNDPPADFETETPYIIVSLDEACRKQQLNEGWFATMEDVPKQAISMSIKQIMKSKNIICAVPDERKAQAVYNCLRQDVSNLFPASILQQHGHCNIYLDTASALLLK